MNEPKNIMTRKEAKAANSLRYFTGIPCKHGHYAEKDTKKGTCVECKSLHATTNPSDDGRTIYIYKLINDVDDRYYIGSTTQRLGTRLYKHRHEVKRGRTTNSLHKAMREIGISRWQMHGLAEFSGDSECDVEFGRSYEARHIADCFNDANCLNDKLEPNPLDITGSSSQP